MSNPPQWNRARQHEMDLSGSRLYEYEQYEIGDDERASGDVAPQLNASSGAYNTASSRFGLDNSTMQITVSNDQYRNSLGSNQKQLSTASAPTLSFRYGIDKLHSSVPTTVRSSNSVDSSYWEIPDANSGQRLPNTYGGSQKQTVVDYGHTALPSNNQPSFNSLGQVREVAQNTGKILSKLDGWQRLGLQQTSVVTNSGRQAAFEDRPQMVSISNSAYTRLSASDPQAQTIMKNISMLGAAFGGSGVSLITRSSHPEAQTKYERSKADKDAWRDMDDRMRPPEESKYGQPYHSTMGYGGGLQISDKAMGEPNKRIPDLVEYPKGILRNQPRQQDTVQSQPACDQIALKFQQSTAAKSKSLAPKSSTPSCDPIITQVLKSIGFNFELSKISQERSYTEEQSKPSSGLFIKQGSNNVSDSAVGRLHVNPGLLTSQVHGISSTEMMSRSSGVASHGTGSNVQNFTSNADQLMTRNSLVARTGVNIGASGSYMTSESSNANRTRTQASNPVVLRYTAKPVMDREQTGSSQQVTDQRFNSEAIADALSAAKRLYSKHNLGKQSDSQSRTIDRSIDAKRRTRSPERSLPKSDDRKQNVRRKSRSPYSTSKSRKTDSVRGADADRTLKRPTTSALKGELRGRNTLPSKRRSPPRKTRSRSRDRRRISSVATRSRSRSRDRRKVSPGASMLRSQVRRDSSSVVASSLSKSEHKGSSVIRRNRSPSPKKRKHHSPSPSKELRRKRSVSPSHVKGKSRDRETAQSSARKEQSPNVAPLQMPAPVYYPPPSFPVPWASRLPFLPHIPVPCVPAPRLPPPVMPLPPKPYSWQRSASRRAGDAHSDWERSTEEFLKKLQQPSFNAADVRDGALKRRPKFGSNVSINSVPSDSPSHLSLSTVSSVELGDYVSVEDSTLNIAECESEVEDGVAECSDELLTNTQKFERLIASKAFLMRGDRARSLSATRSICKESRRCASESRIVFQDGHLCIQTVDDGQLNGEMKTRTVASTSRSQKRRRRRQRTAQRKALMVQEKLTTENDVLKSESENVEECTKFGTDNSNQHIMETGGTKEKASSVTELNGAVESIEFGKSELNKKNDAGKRTVARIKELSTGDNVSDTACAKKQLACDLKEDVSRSVEPPQANSGEQGTVVIGTHSKVKATGEDGPSDVVESHQMLNKLYAKSVDLGSKSESIILSEGSITDNGGLASACDSSKKVAAKSKVGREQTEVGSKTNDQNWCGVCGDLCGTLDMLLDHLKSSRHEMKLAHELHDIARNKKIDDRSSFRGAEFIVAVTHPFFCKLCYSFCSCEDDVKSHLRCLSHVEKYRKYVRDNPQYERFVLERKRTGSVKTQDGQSKSASKATKRSTARAVDEVKSKKLKAAPRLVAGDVIDLTQESSTKSSEAKPLADSQPKTSAAVSAVDTEKSSAYVNDECSVDVDEQAMASPYSVISNDSLASDNRDVELLEPISDDDLDVNLADECRLVNDSVCLVEEVSESVLSKVSPQVAVQPSISDVDLLDPISDEDEEANVANESGAEVVRSVIKSVCQTEVDMNSVEGDFIILSSLLSGDNVIENKAVADKLVVDADTATSVVGSDDCSKNGTFFICPIMEAVISTESHAAVDDSVKSSSEDFVLPANTSNEKPDFAATSNVTEKEVVCNDEAGPIVSNLDSLISSSVRVNMGKRVIVKLGKRVVVKSADCSSSETVSESVSDASVLEKTSAAVLPVENVRSPIPSLSTGVSCKKQDEIVILSDTSLSDVESVIEGEPVSSKSSQSFRSTVVATRSFSNVLLDDSSVESDVAAKTSVLHSIEAEAERDPCWSCEESVVHHSDDAEFVNPVQLLEDLLSASVCSGTGLVETARQPLPGDSSTTEFEPSSSVVLVCGETPVDTNNENVDIQTDDDDDFEIELL